METGSTLLSNAGPPGAPGSEAPPASGPGLTFADATLQQSASLQRYQSADDLGKAYLSLEQKLGQRPVEIPGEQAAPEAWQAFWKQLPGYPESDDKYTSQLPQLPQGLEVDPELFKSFRKGAHAQGLTDKQLQYVLGFYGEHLVAQPYLQQQQQQEAEGQATMRALTQKYGTTASQTVLATAREYIRREYGEESAFLNTLVTKDGEARALGNIPEFIEMAYRLGLSKGYNQYVQGDGSGGLLSLGGAEAELRRAEEQYLKKEISDRDYNAAVHRLQPLITAARQAQQTGNRL